MRNGGSGSPHAYLQGVMAWQRFYQGMLFMGNIRIRLEMLCQNNNLVDAITNRRKYKKGDAVLTDDPLFHL
jgi:hypothetical protein